MKRLIATNSHNLLATIARIALGVTIFPHGAQKLLGWFGGYGYTGTMGFLTGQMHLPAFLATLVILTESIGAVLLILGFLTRFAALAITMNFIGVVYLIHMHNGFFMNWSMVAGKGEGYEYFILLFGLSLISLIAGGGAASADAALTSRPAPSRSLR